MAFQTRHRDPLFDSDTQAVIERRGKELVGLTLLGLAILMALMLGTYSPDDPNWLNATDAPARNVLGPLGAAIASPLYVIAGYGAWAIAAIMGVWGLRFLTHYGEDRAMSRLIFAPICVALVSVYASTHLPGAGWVHSFGLGGLFGDTVLGAVLGVLPVAPGTGLKVMALVLFASAIAMSSFVLGFNRDELWTYARYLLGGVILMYATLMTALGRGAVGGMRMAADARARAVEKRASTEALPEVDTGIVSPAVLRATRAFREGTEQSEKIGLLKRLPSLLKRKTAEDTVNLTSAPLAEGMSARVTAAVNSRVRRPDGLRAEPPLMGAAAAPRTVMLDEFGELATYDDDLAGRELPEPELVVTQHEPGGGFHSSRPVVQHKTAKPAASKRARAEAQPQLNFDGSESAFEMPPLSLLSDPAMIERHHLPDESLEENARMLESVLDDYGVKGEIVSVRPGPVVTMYELEPAPGLKASRVIGLADDIARSMSALSARVSTVPGRSVIGIELPNENREKVVLRELLSGRDYGDGNHRLPLALGKNIGGDPVVANLAKMPHLLIAGTTGSGKSVAINTMILSLLDKRTPE